MMVVVFIKVLAVHVRYLPKAQVTKYSYVIVQKYDLCRLRVCTIALWAWRD